MHLVIRTFIGHTSHILTQTYTYKVFNMLFSLPIASVLLVAGSVAASPYTPSALLRRENDTASRSNSSTPNVVRSTWDGTCFYPTADETFDLDEYLGKWYQVAGTLAEFTAGCTCITAEYSLNVSWCFAWGFLTWCKLTIEQRNGTGVQQVSDPGPSDRYCGRGRHCPRGLWLEGSVERAVRNV